MLSTLALPRTCNPYVEMLDPSSYYHMNPTRALTLAHITCYVVDTSATLGGMKGGSVAIVVHRRKQPHQP